MGSKMSVVKASRRPRVHVENKKTEPQNGRDQDDWVDTHCQGSVLLHRPPTSLLGVGFGRELCGGRCMCRRVPPRPPREDFQRKILVV